MGGLRRALSIGVDFGFTYTAPASARMWAKLDIDFAGTEWKPTVFSLSV